MVWSDHDRDEQQQMKIQISKSNLNKANCNRCEGGGQNDNVNDCIDSVDNIDSGDIEGDQTRAGWMTDGGAVMYVCMFNSYPTTKYKILHDRALNQGAKVVN